MSAVFKVKKVVDSIVALFVGAILMIMAITIAVSVVLRYLKMGISWTEELVRAGVVWTTFLGSYAATTKNKDIRVKMLVERFPQKVQTVCEIVSELLVLIFLSVFIVLSFKYTAQFASYRLPMTGMSRGLLYSVFPIGSCLMGVHSLLSLICKVGALIKGDDCQIAKEC